MVKSKQSKSDLTSQVSIRIENMMGERIPHSFSHRQVVHR